MKTTRILVGVIGAVVLSACASSVQAEHESQAGERRSLCRITDDLGKYLDSEVSVIARYVSDGRHEEVLESVCDGQRRILDIGKRSQAKSVVEFYSERQRLCAERGSEYLCNVEAEVEMIGAISVMSDEYVLNVREVKSFKFAD